MRIRLPHPPGAAGARPRPVVRAVAALGAALALAGCGVRLDSAPPEQPTPDVVEVQRQSAAVAAARIAATAEEVAEAEPAVVALLEEVSEQSRAHADALGGVWLAWPEGAPEGVRTTAPNTAPPVAAPSAQDVLDQLTRGAADARVAALSTPEDTLAATLAAVSISRSQAAADLSAALGSPVPPAEGAPLPADALLARGVDGPTVAVLDQARHAYETVAARSSGSARDTAAARATHFQVLVDTAVAAGAPDRRLPYYGGPAVEGLAPEQAAVLEAEEDVLAHWVFSITLAAPVQRESLISAAEYAAGRVRAWGGTLGDLPGLG